MSTMLTCEKADCKVLTTGVCSEGHAPLESCPHYGKAPDPDSIEDDDTELEAPESNGIFDQVAVPSGEALTPAQVDEFLRWRPATLIAIIGDRDSGKTTLLAALYGCFLRAPFAGHLFAGSRTLVGFEKRVHDSRVESGRTEPDTARTSIAEELRYVHLGLAPEHNVNDRVDLLVADRAGEAYRLARNDSKLVADLIEVSSANRVLLILDGARVSEAALRSGALQAVRQSLRALSDGGALGPTATVQVVTTKIDLLLNHPEKTLIESKLADFKNRLTTDFGGRVGQLTFWDIAARDPRGQLPLGFGLDQLLSDWITPRPAVVPTARIPKVTSELDRLLVRTSMEALP